MFFVSIKLTSFIFPLYIKIAFFITSPNLIDKIPKLLAERRDLSSNPNSSTYLCKFSMVFVISSVHKKKLCLQNYSI
jgi:hypothetical protein